MKIHLVNLNVPIFEQLQLEEALLRADDRNFCLINHGSPPAIVMGISGKKELLIHPNNELPIIRRFSGGGTVVVDENTLFVTWICNTRDTNITPYPDKIHAWTENFYQSIFVNKPFALRENDYVFGERKFGGNAQYIRKDRWLHHSTFLWTYNPNHMNSLLFPPKTPAYRAQRNHNEFLCSLNEFYSCRDTFLQNLRNSCKNHFETHEINEKDLTPIKNNPHRQTTHHTN